MRDLHRFLENPFDDPGISLAELLAFSSDHLQRMMANNASGELAARITATTSALTLVQNCATDDGTKLAVRKARVQVKDGFRKNVPKEVGKVHGMVVGHFGAGAPEVTECFPEGRTIFSECTDDQLELKVQTTVNGLTAHVAVLGAPLVAQAQGLLDSWKAIHLASDTSTGAVTTTQEGKQMARENLQLMLFLNLLKLAEMFARQPAQLDLYMQQSLLEDQPVAPPEPPAPPAPPTP